MRTLAIMLFFITAISASAAAAPKQLDCTLYDEEKNVFLKWTGLFDTDDFTKNNPDYEFTITYVKDPDVIVFEKSIINPQPITTAEVHTVGQTYRYKFSVTPSTITFNWIFMPNNPTGEGVLNKFDVSRETLSFTYGNRKGSCKLTDYKPKKML